MLKTYFANWWSRVGVALVVLGWGPLLSVGLLSEAGLLSDPNPNPVGFGIMFAFTLWPAVICLAIGAFKVWRGRREVRKGST